MELVGAVFGLTISIALIVNFALARGVAISRIDDHFVLYFPFSRRKVNLAGVTISKTEHQAMVPNFGSANLSKPPSVIALQVTMRRAGQPDLNFRTGLLRESADIIVERMSALAR